LRTSSSTAAARSPRDAAWACAFSSWISPSMTEPPSSTKRCPAVPPIPSAPPEISATFPSIMPIYRPPCLSSAFIKLNGKTCQAAQHHVGRIGQRRAFLYPDIIHPLGKLLERHGHFLARQHIADTHMYAFTKGQVGARSEERRVGKACIE